MNIETLIMARQRVSDEGSLKLFEFLQNDLKSLSIETKKKFPHIKEVSIVSVVLKLHPITFTTFHLLDFFKTSKVTAMPFIANMTLYW